MNRAPAPRLVLALLAVTILVLLTDLARPAWTEPIRSASATVFAPVQDAARGWSQDDLDDARAERDALAVDVDRLRAEQDAAARQGEIVVPPGTSAGGAVGARVVAVAPRTSPVGALVVTIDAGAADGVRADRAVVNADGLVGRVVSVNATSSEVLLLSDPKVVVGVRFGPEGSLGSLSAQAPPELPARAAGELTLTGIGEAPIQVGDRVRTLGSPDDSPFAADIEVGTVTAVDPDAGQLGRTAVVDPAVETDTLDAVVVLTGRADG